MHWPRPQTCPSHTVHTQALEQPLPPWAGEGVVYQNKTIRAVLDSTECAESVP